MAKWRWGRRRDGGRRSLSRGLAVEGVRATDGGAPPPSAQQVTGSGDAVADNGGIAVTGIYNDNSSVLLPPEVLRSAAKVKAPRGMNDLPYLPAHFVGRASELAALDTALRAPGEVHLQAVHGLGGVGKSALAAQWAATRSHGLKPIRWITADSPAGVQQGLAALAIGLQPALAKVLTTDALAEYALQWLAGHTGWLLVLDNVTDPADIAGLLARAPRGRFLITSRLATTWTTATTVIRLDVLDPAESLTLLTRVTTAAGPRDLDGAAELCAEIGQLPLAVGQAAAYLAQNPLLTPRGYLDLLRRNPGETLQRGGEGRTAAERTVARVWRVTLDRIAELQPSAVEVLRTLAWYAPDRIPAHLLDGTAAPPDVNGAIGLLNAYSMIGVDPVARTLSVHRLVQGLARTSDPDDPHRDRILIEVGRVRAACLLQAVVVPLSWRDTASWPLWRSLIPHVEALAGYAPASDDLPVTAELLNHAGGYLHSQGLADRAVTHLERALAHRERDVGPDHLRTSDSLNNLAAARHAIGDLAGAISLFERAIVVTERRLGEDHPLSVGSRSNLAAVVLETGDVVRATEMYEQALADSVRLGGHEHYLTIVVRCGLANALLAGGHFDRALVLQQQTVAISVRVLGEEHPDTLAARLTLVKASQAAGDPARSIPLYERLRRTQDRVLGEDHPHSFAARSSLAFAHQASGDPGRAIEQFERAVEDQTRALGEDHPDTLASRSRLADAYAEAGDPQRAIEFCGRVFDDRLRILGEDHPDTLVSLESLAGAHRAAGALDRAVKLCGKVLEGRLRLLGAAHPATLNALSNLAAVHVERGEPGRAVPLFEQSLATMLRELGEGHPHIPAARLNLASAHLEAGDPGTAIPLLERALAADLRKRGDDDSRTLAVLHALASAHRDAGNAAAVVPLCERIRASRERTLGKVHPETLRAASHLALAHREAGDAKRALPLLKATFRAQWRILGPGHIDVLTSCHNLAQAHHQAGDLGKAVRLYRRTLILGVPCLGEDDPLTISARAHLAAAYAERQAR